MKEIYLLSGLGADRRVFDYLDLADFKLNYIDWLEPLYREPIEDYASRLLKQIITPKPILVGVSFGGIMAIEIGKLIPTDKIVLISSAKSRSGIPWYYQLMGKLRLHKLVPTNFLKKANRITFWFFGVTSEANKDLLRAILSETDPKFLKWAMDKIVNWRSTNQLSNVFHIHGTKDRVLPIGTWDHCVIGGGHLMILENAKEVSQVIKKAYKPMKLGYQ